MTIDKVPSIELAKILRDVFESDLPDQITRLEKIYKIYPNENSLKIGIVSTIYLEESLYCYLHGNFIASIIMMGSAFEAFFKTIVDGEKFHELIKNVYDSELIDSQEYEQLNYLRKTRNTILHYYEHILSNEPMPIGRSLKSRNLRKVTKISDKIINLTILFQDLQKNRVPFKIFKTE